MVWSGYLPSPHRRDVHGEPRSTTTHPCLRCRKPFESEGAPSAVRGVLE